MRHHRKLTKEQRRMLEEQEHEAFARYLDACIQDADLQHVRRELHTAQDAAAA